MDTSEIKAMQEEVKKAGYYRGEVDGLWGPRSQDACRRYLRMMMPYPNPWPVAKDSALRKFYGAPGDESKLVRISFPYPMYYGGKLVTSTRVHERCADSLLKVLVDIKGLLPSHPGIRDEAEDYGGVFNFRVKRGGTSYSLHAYGAAIDLDADDNSFRAPWPIVADMPLEIIKAFAREGWKSGGAFWGYDAMHFEATSSVLA